MPAIRYTRIISLSHAIHEHIPRWPGDPPARFEQAASLAEDGYNLRQFTLGEHSATHLNAPACFFPGGADVSAITPAQLVLPAVVFDRAREARLDPCDALPLSAVLAWEQQHGAVAPGSLCLLRSGWGSRWDDPPAFLPADLRTPGFSLEAARFLVEERAAGGLGTDAPGLEPGSDADFQVNRLYLAAGRLALECLANLEQLPARGAVVCALPLPLRGGTGSPAGVIAFLP